MTKVADVQLEDDKRNYRCIYFTDHYMENWWADNIGTHSVLRGRKSLLTKFREMLLNLMLVLTGHVNMNT